jgi:hypothetical protein
MEPLAFGSKPSSADCAEALAAWLMSSAAAAKRER